VAAHNDFTFLKNFSLDYAVECHVASLRENLHPAWQEGAILSEERRLKEMSAPIRLPPIA
jgi:hypothetical protein